MRAKGQRIPEEVKDAVCRDYQKGDKVIVITMEHGIDAGSLYRILDERHIPLRRGSRKVRISNPLGVDPVDEAVKSAEKLKRGSVPSRPGEFVLTITSKDLMLLSDDEFTVVWDALGMIVKARAERGEKGEEG